VIASRVLTVLVPAIAAMALACPRALAGPRQPAAARSWTAADLESLSRILARTEAPYTQLIKGKTYGALLLRRAVSGDPELHVRMNDFFVVLSGEGEIEVGGRVTGERTVAPDEKRGEKLVGGALYRVKRGDVLLVPANHWLQVLIARGQVLRAIIIKTE
jgi:mannose-6-phosphate isomerase-like protein (cupin superfamily)